MLGYTTAGTNDFDKAVAFYDEVFKVMGAKRLMETNEYVAWGKAPNDTMFSITKPFNKEAASVGNGVMFALAAENPEQVDAIYNKAIELGGKCEGPAGPRGEMAGFYAGYFRDLDGNKLNAFCIVEQ